MERRISKEEQEAEVAAHFATAFGALTGAPATGNVANPEDPPDRLFRWRGLSLGLELFELEQFHDTRSFLDSLTQHAYREFESAVGDDRFVGVAVWLGSLVELETKERASRAFRQVDHRLGDAARELVRLAVSSVSPGQELPDNDRGRLIAVDSHQYPPLAAMTHSVVFSRCAPQHTPRSGRWPDLIVDAAYRWSDEEMIGRANDAVRGKMSDRQRWSPSVDRSVLVAHDFPRWREYRGFGPPWGKWLQRVASDTNVLDAFDEFWLIPFVGDGGGPIGDGAANARRIAARE